jgi:hypothetical protein
MLLSILLSSFAATAVVGLSARGSNTTLLSRDLTADLSRLKGDDQYSESRPLNALVNREAERIDAIATQARNGSAEDRASKACLIMSVLFGNRTVTVDSSAYKAESEESWYVDNCRSSNRVSV